MSCFRTATALAVLAALRYLEPGPLAVVRFSLDGLLMAGYAYYSTDRRVRTVELNTRSTNVRQ